MGGAVDDGRQAEADERGPRRDAEAAVQHRRAGVGHGRTGQHDEGLGGAEADGRGLRGDWCDNARKTDGKGDPATAEAPGTSWDGHEECPHISGEQSPGRSVPW